MMEEALKAAGCDTKKMPLGKISAKMVKEGYGSLKKIEAELSKKKPDKKTLADLTSVFFTVVPHDIGFKKLSDFTIDDNTKLKEKLDLVDSLQQIEYANAITVDNGVDAMYKKLNMEIEPLPKSDADYKLVAKMVNNMHGKSHGHFTLELTNVFRLRKETQEKKCREHLSLFSNFIQHNTTLAFVKVREWCQGTENNFGVVVRAPKK